ncbi:hypothetical protein PIB30_085421 [Stylosanthes scabra]|uniref:Uncharacterized protein n=1 Tax=Stylosanthes scabra TaxID=79078 RepID=A0ABU6QT25_9FABA|nr:hypothetical protein [Stylosanthes scabra]
MAIMKFKFLSIPSPSLNVFPHVHAPHKRRVKQKRKKKMMDEMTKNQPSHWWWLQFTLSVVDEAESIEQQRKTRRHHASPLFEQRIIPSRKKNEAPTIVIPKLMPRVRIMSRMGINII